jgi:hypothetical protein
MTRVLTRIANLAGRGGRPGVVWVAQEDVGAAAAPAKRCKVDLQLKMTAVFSKMPAQTRRPIQRNVGTATASKLVGLHTFKFLPTHYAKVVNS